MLTKEQVIKMFDRWPKYFGPKVGACDVVLDYDTNHNHYKSNGCHGIMYNVKLGVKAVYSSLWCRDEKLFDAACEYWDYLLDIERSPFRLALKGVTRLYDDKGRPLAFGLHDMEAPSQVCVPLMMQCRVPQENTNKLRAYAEYRKHFDIPRSFFLSEHFYFIDGLFYKNTSTYEHAFAPRQGINFTRMLNGTPSALKEGQCWAKTGAPYTPVTAVWKEGANNKVWGLFTDVVKYDGLFEKFFKKVVSANGTFPPSHTGAVTPSKMIETLKANSEGW